MAGKLDHQIVDFHDQAGSAEALPWLPTYILNDGIEACGDSGEDDDRFFTKRRSVLIDEMEAYGEGDYGFYSKEQNYNKHRQQPPSGRKLTAAAQPPLLPSPVPPQWKNYSKADQKTKYHTNWATGGPGMQAVFLVSGQKSCGTGVFLPRTAGAEAEKPRKPAFAPILLPSRVVQALNLNVHGLGLQIKPRDNINNNTRGGVECGDRAMKSNKKNRGDMSSQIQCTVISQNRSSSSPEIFLPKEWTY